MENLNILCVEDQKEVLAALVKDLEYFDEYFSIVECDSAAAASEALEEIHSEGGKVVLMVCDHVMPGQSGIDFMIDVNNDPRFKDTKKILLTGLATQQDAIMAINEAEINYYVEKPWDSADLIAVIKKLLTKYIIQTDLDYATFAKIIDHDTLQKELRG